MTKACPTMLSSNASVTDTDPAPPVAPPRDHKLKTTTVVDIQSPEEVERFCKLTEQVRQLLFKSRIFKNDLFSYPAQR